jgi:hypothetical protein
MLDEDDNTYRCEQTPDAVEIFFDGHVFLCGEGTLA